MGSLEWDRHYARERSNLRYPDENLLRLVHKKASGLASKGVALDLGCGSGRHLPILAEAGFDTVAGSDISMDALILARRASESPLVLSDNTRLPLKGDSVDLAVSWGSLHYSDKAGMKLMLAEIHRVLRPGGVLLASLRSSDDTCLKRGRHLGDNVWITDLHDLEGSKVSFYSEAEIPDCFSLFGTCSFGFTKRSIVGDRDSVIAHWVITAEKA